jgi:hypothetical protein
VARPELLLNPWAVRSTETGEQTAEGGEDYKRVPVPAPPAAATPPPTESAAAGAGGDFADLDFLADPAAVLVNLVPDKDGVVRIARSKIGPHALVRVVAVETGCQSPRTGQSVTKAGASREAVPKLGGQLWPGRLV